METATNPTPRRVPWHGATVDVDPLWTVTETLDRAGLNFEASKAQNSYTNPVTGARVAAKGSHTVVRGDSGYQLAKGSVGDVQSFVQPREQLVFAGDVGAAGAPCVQVGSVRGGATVFTVHRFPAASFYVDGDSTEQVDVLALLKNPFDGSGALTCDLVAQRLFCSNQLPQLAKGGVFKLRHTTSLADRWADAQLTVERAAAYAVDYADTARRLLAVDVEREQVEQLVHSWLPDRAERGKDAREAERDDLLANVFGSPTVQREHRLTGWGVLNAATEWAEHLREYRTNVRTNPAEARFLRNQRGGAVESFRSRVFADLSALVPASN